ncbi:MAG: tyrosine-type recombinase/integrase [Cytophagales bacterium]|nr:tyrosine-type recombinase/integrase [Armatimonadota bacterium]
MRLAEENAAADLLAAYTAGRNARTLLAYQQDLEQFRIFVKASSPREAVVRLLQCSPGTANGLTLAYRAHLLERGLTPATVNRRLASLRSLAKLARLLGLVTWAIEVPGLPTEAYRDTRGPGREGFRRLLAALDAAPPTPITLRDRAILRLLYDLGLRRGEVAALDLADVDKERGTVAVLGKRRLEKTLLSLPSATNEALQAWITVRGGAAGPLFLNFDRAKKGDGRLSPHSLYRTVRARGEEAGIKTAPHGLRHTAITEAIKAAQRNGIGLEEVLDFSRHQDVKVMMIYRDRERNVQGRLSALVAETAPNAADETNR